MCRRRWSGNQKQLASGKGKLHLGIVEFSRSDECSRPSGKSLSGIFQRSHRKSRCPYCLFRQHRLLDGQRIAFGRFGWAPTCFYWRCHTFQCCWYISLSGWQYHRRQKHSCRCRPQNCDNVCRYSDRAFRTKDRCLNCTFRTWLGRNSSLFWNQRLQWTYLQTSMQNGHVLDVSSGLSW